MAPKLHSFSCVAAVKVRSTCQLCLVLEVAVMPVTLHLTYKEEEAMVSRPSGSRNKWL
jgi:hypothetical protein